MRYKFIPRKTLRQIVTAKRKYKLRLYKQQEQKPQQHYYITISPIDENTVLLSKSRNALIEYIKTAFRLMNITFNDKNVNDIIKKIGKHDLTLLQFTGKQVEYIHSAYDFTTEQLIFKHLTQVNGIYNNLKDCINAIIHDSKKYTKKPKITHIDLNRLKIILNGGNIIYKVITWDNKFTFKLVHVNK